MSVYQDVPTECETSVSRPSGSDHAKNGKITNS